MVVPRTPQDESMSRLCVCFKGKCVRIPVLPKNDVSSLQRVSDAESTSPPITSRSRDGEITTPAASTAGRKASSEAFAFFGAMAMGLFD